jgi:hypothetical protein
MKLPIRQPTLFLASIKHPPSMPHWLTHMGALGLFSVAVVDSSPIPLPLPGSTDLLLLLLVAHGGDPLLLGPMAIAGSILGGYTTWQVGRRGGEAALRRYVPVRLLVRVVGWVDRHRILAVFLPALLPPPIRSYRLRLPPARWVFRAGASSPFTVRLAPCATPLLPGWLRSTDGGSSVCGLEASTSGRLR